MTANLCPGGRAILSGILTGQADEVTAHYARHGINLIERADIGEWSTLMLGKL
jgi:ribosomal protein L11 methyltransferase